MSSTENSETTTAPETRAKTAKQPSQGQVVDKFAEARLAKKKQRRRAHRATIRRSNTNG